MRRVATFAGLGSESLFKDTTLHKAAQDASLPESQILLRCCHAAFRTQITAAVQREQLPPGSIDLDDFQLPDDLLKPPLRYRRNVVVQHATIFLVQILRYLGSRSSTTADRLGGAAGFCVGLFPAATILTADDDEVKFLQRAIDFFRITLWLGIHCEEFRLEQLARYGCPQDLPWSVVIDNASGEIADAFRVGADLYESVYVSAKSSPSCYTLSGRGDELERYVSQRLAAPCRTRATGVFTLYHHQQSLQSVLDKTMGSIETDMSRQLGDSVRLSAPLFSSVQGAAFVTGEMSLKQLVMVILEMILQKPVDWVSVQEAVLAQLQQQAGDDSDLGPCEILNYGPGYGMSRSAVSIPKAVQIRDMSAAGSHSNSASSSKISPNDVAIVGMAVDLPDASNADELWNNLINGRNSVSEIPASRFHIDDFYDRKDPDGGKSKRSIKTRYGNFLKNPFLFDNDLFDISPREAKSMDPQQRVLLQTAYRALEDAGYVPDATPSNSRDTFGCFIGSATLDYTDNLAKEIDVYYSPGTLRAFQSGRISYYFGWSGPSLTLDTACSSSMVAMHQAVRAIRAGDCRAALVGGANVITSPDMYLGLDRAHFLSSSGQCKAFDASADGYCRAEGCGVFVLKKLRDALAEGDRIHGVIKGIEANQSGNAHSITHPHSPTQEKLFKSLLKKSGVHPHHVSLAETHGTGTQAGDPNELQSLRNAFCQGRDPRNPLHFSSIKANIGHCEAASGGASLAKVLLMMRHGRIPPQISLKNLNPKIAALNVDGAVIDPHGAAWQQREMLGARHQPRIALVHNIGAAGSNAAMIVQEYEEELPRESHTERNGELTHTLGISGKSAKVVTQLRDNLVAHLAGVAGEQSVADICYTMTARRQLYGHRIAVTGSSVQELAQNLSKAEPVHVSAAQKGVNDPVVFVFSGQGSQYLGMGQQLLSMYPVFSQTVHKIDQVLRENGFPSCMDIINASTTPDDTALDDTTQMQAFQSAIFALEVALARLLASWGVTPAAVIGHSLGEYAALVSAGVLDIASGALLVARRAQLLATKCELVTTSMLAVNMPASTVQTLISQSDERFAEVEISCDNSPTDCVAGGPIRQLNDLKGFLSDRHAAKSKFLQVPMAYHTRAVDPMLPGLVQYARRLTLSKPIIPVISTVLGRVVQPGEDVFTPEYLEAHSRGSVYFRKALASLLSSASHASAQWIEIGPHASLLPMIKAQTSSSPQPVNQLLPCIRKGVSPSVTLSQLLAQLYLKGLPIDWRQAFRYHTQPRFISLPELPFFQNEFVVAYPRESSKIDDARISVPQDVFLGQTIQEANEVNGWTAIYETPIQFLKDFITGHMVCEHALCPASVYHQMALSAAKAMAADDTVPSLGHIEYVSPLLYASHSTTLVRLEISSTTGASQERFSFEVSSLAEPIASSDRNSQNQIHCRGQIKIKSAKSTEQKHSRTTQVMRRQIDRLSRQDPHAIVETLSTRAMYDHVFPRVVTYSKLYQLVQSIRISPDYGEAYARCRVPMSPSETLSSVDGASKASAAKSIFMDVLLHVAGFVANMSVSSEVACICKEVSSALVFREPNEDGAYFDVCCTLTSEGGHIVADAQACDENGFMASFSGMVFQKVQLNKISKAFEITSKRTTQGSTTQPHRVTGATVKTSTPTSTQRLGIKDVPELELPRPAFDIRVLVAETCGADLAAAASDASLEELGFDSLLLIELHGQLSSRYPSIDATALGECVTVGDLEKLCGGRDEASLTPSITATPSPTSCGTPATDPVDHDVQRMTRLIVAETCSLDYHVIDSNSELASLGIDSLMIYELESSLANLTKDGSLTMSKLSECRTVGDVEKLIIGDAPSQDHDSLFQHSISVFGSESDSSAQSDDFSSIASSGTCSPHHTESLGALTPLSHSRPLFEPSTLERVSHMLKLNGGPVEVIEKPSGSHQDLSPLFLIHDGSGICTHYHRLKRMNRAVYALHDPKFLDPVDSWTSLGQMADHYADTITSVTTGPLLMAGWSFGGVVAFEVARRLLARGHKVVGTVLIDAPPPLKHQPLPPAIIDAVTSAQDSSRSPATDATRAIRYFIRRSFASCANLLGSFRPPTTSFYTSSPLPPAFLLISREGWRHPTDASFMEHPWLQDRSNPHTSVAGWEAITGGQSVPWAAIPGNHFQAFDAPNIPAVAEAMRHAVRELETTIST